MDGMRHTEKNNHAQFILYTLLTERYFLFLIEYINYTVRPVGSRMVTHHFLCALHSSAVNLKGNNNAGGETTDSQLDASHLMNSVDTVVLCIQTALLNVDL